MSQWVGFVIHERAGAGRLAIQPRNIFVIEKMNMLQSLCLENFQRHQKFSIDFDPYLSVLTGPSDVGKSAVLRALRWLINNRPAGRAFIQHGQEQVNVRLRLDDHVIIRNKGKTDNCYKLDGRVYRSFASDVPEPIAQLLNVAEVNFQGQYNSPFWFMLAPGQVARELNQIVNLQVIDRTLTNLASELRRARTAVAISRERLQESRRQRQELLWAVAAHTELKYIEKQYNIVILVQEKRARLTAILENGHKYSEVSQSVSEAQPDAQRVLSLGQEAQRIGERTRRLRGLLNDWRRWEGQERQLRKAAEKMSKELAKEMAGKCPLCGRPMP